MPVNSEFIVIARIVRPQGRHGEVLADILTDFPEKFAERTRLWLAAADGSSQREYTLEEYWLHKGRVVLKFAGIDSINDAETLNGMLLQIPSDARALLEPGTFYVGDLVGSVVIDVSGEQRREVGVIDDVEQGVGAAPLLVVSNSGREYEIPFAEEYIVFLDLERKTLEMKLPTGLLEVNAPLSDEEKQQRDE